MAKNYIVVLDSIPSENDDFRDDYFPRGFHYKKDADELVLEVEGRGGKAHIVPKSQFEV